MIKRIREIDGRTRKRANHRVKGICTYSLYYLTSLDVPNLKKSGGPLGCKKTDEKYPVNTDW